MAPRTHPAPPVCVLAVATTLLLAACAPVPPPLADPSRSGAATAELDVRALEQAIHGQINAARRRHGVGALGWDADVAGVARDHSRNMAENGFFSHVDPEGAGPSERAAARGLRCRKEVDVNTVAEGFAENIYQTYHYASVRTTRRDGEMHREYVWKTLDEIARDVVQGWLDSPGHRANLLNPAHDAEGVGVARTREHAIYVTQNLC